MGDAGLCQRELLDLGNPDICHCVSEESAQLDACRPASPLQSHPVTLLSPDLPGLATNLTPIQDNAYPSGITLPYYRY